MSEFKPDPSQQAVMDCRQRLCVVAGAGSGKTGTLVAALVARLSEALEPGYNGQVTDITDILALTFTEKAAGELRERLGRAFRELRRAAIKADGCAHSRKSPTSPEHFDGLRPARGRISADEFWRRQAARLDRADIGTIHGYALKLVRENAQLLGLTNTPALDDDDRALGRDLAEQITDWLDQDDRDLLSLLETYPLTTLSAMLEKCATGLSSWGLARLTIRGSAPTAEIIPAVGLSAFAELAAEGLNLVRHGDLNRSKPYYQKVLTAMEALNKFLASSTGRLPGDYDAVLLEADQLLKSGGNWYSRQGKPMYQRLRVALDELKSARHEQLAGPLKTKLLNLANRLPEALAARKRRRGSINFDDILILARRLLAIRPEIRRREIARRRLVVVDEFQDTNRLQADLLAYLLLPSDDDTVYDEYQPLWENMDWKRASGRLSVFGDLKQSIYRFRGAEPEIMASLRQAFDRGNGQVLALDHNYRSQEPLVRFFNTMFPVHLNEGFTKLDYQRPLRPALYPGPQVARLQSLEPAPPGIDERVRNQARMLSRYLGELVSGRTRVLVDKGRVPEPGDVAILFRSFTWAPVIRECLAEAGWKCRLAIGDNPFDYAEVRGLMAAFAYLSGLDLDLNLAALLRSPLGPVSDETLTRLAWPNERKRAMGLSEYFKQPLAWPEKLDPEDLKTLEELRSLLGDLAPVVGRLPPVEILEKLVEERRLLPLVRPETDGEHRVRAVTSFLALSRRLGRDRDHLSLGPAEELREIARTWDPRRDNSETDPEESGAVTLMTVHASKGLEFPVVILAATDSRPRFNSEPVVISREGVMALSFKNAAGATIKPADFSDIETEEKAREIEENGRLFYVAATRARDHLVLLGQPNAKKEEARKNSSADKDANNGNHKAKRPDIENPAEPAAAVSVVNNGEIVWLEALLDCPEAAAQTELVEYGQEDLAPNQIAAPNAPTTAAALPGWSSEAPRLMEPMNLNGQTLAVTAFCRLLADPAAYYRENVLGLEHGEADGGLGWFWEPRAELDAPPSGHAPAPCGSAERLAPDQAGILFHAVLEAVDPQRPRIEELLQSQSARLGFKPGPAETTDLADRLNTFLSGPCGLAWRESVADFRELPFRLQLPGPQNQSRLTLTGIIDLFFLTPDGTGHIVDYKLAIGRPGPELTAYEHQTRVYGQAMASAGFSGRLKAALYFAGGKTPFIHQVELAHPDPMAPLWPLLEKNFQLLLKTRPLRPDRPMALNIV